VDVVLDRIARAVMMIEAHVAMMTVARGVMMTVAHAGTTTNVVVTAATVALVAMMIDARAVMTIAPIREPMRNEKAMRSSVASVSVA
jgi:hypothetical protein